MPEQLLSAGEFGYDQMGAAMAGYEPDPMAQIEAAMAEVEAMKSREAQAKAEADAVAARADLLAHCNSWINRSSSWRKASYEDKWHAYRRAADSVYDPQLAAKKESWQSKAYIPITPTHRETIKAELYKTMAGVRPPLEVKPLVPAAVQGNDQSDNVRDLTVREIDKSRYEVAIDKVLDDATTYGSGFCILRHEVRTAERRIREPRYENVATNDPAMLYAAMSGQREVVAYDDFLQEVEVYRGVVIDHLPIWDVFPDPQALEVRGSDIAYRYRLSYDEIRKGAEKGPDNGGYFPDALAVLDNVPSERLPDEKSSERSDRTIAEETAPKPKYGAEYECYVFFAKLPAKWILGPDAGEGDPERLVCAKIHFHPKAILWAGINDAYDGEAELHKLDYMPVPGQFYARGLCEMLKHIQEVINETVNQRIDNVGLVMNRMWGVIENNLVDEGDLVSRPGQFIRIKGKQGVTDIRQVIMPFDMPDVTQSSYSDVTEMERYAQERTGANRQTIGTAGQVNDSNKTLGGMQMLLDTAKSKFSAIGMLMEFSFLHQLFRAYWRLIYANITPQEVQDALGPERAATFVLESPEEVERKYQYVPQGVYTMENQALRQARLQSIADKFWLEPWFSKMGAFDQIVKSAKEDPDTLKLSPEEMQMRIMAEAQMQAALEPVPEPGAKTAPVGRQTAKDGPGGAR